MCREGWCVGLGKKGVVCVRVGDWNTLKGGRLEKSGGETKILKGGQAGSRGVCLIKGKGTGTPL